MLEFQRLLLGDQVRNDAFAKALKYIVVPGESVVADIGSGTGFLSFLASRLGAKECHLYEMGDVLDVSKEIAECNDIGNCKFFHEHSLRVKRPVKADIVVSETLGNFALEEHIIETMDDARRRFLKPGGTLIPGALSLFAAPVVSGRLRRDIDVWDRAAHGVDLSLAREMGWHNIYVRAIEKSDLLSGKAAVQRLETIDFTKPQSSVRTWKAEWKILSTVAIDGLAVFWEAQLVPGVTLSTSPLSPRTHWDQIYMPLNEILPARAGDRLSVTIDCDTRLEVGINVAWEASLIRADSVIRRLPRQEMAQGYLD